MLDDKDTKRIQWSYADRTHDKAENYLMNDRMESSRIRETQQDRNATGNSEKENSVSSSSQQKYDNSQLSRIGSYKLSKNNAVAGRCVALQRRKQKRWKRTATVAKRKVWEKELIKSKIITCDHLPSRRNGTGRDGTNKPDKIGLSEISSFPILAVIASSRLTGCYELPHSTSTSEKRLGFGSSLPSFNE